MPQTGLSTCIWNPLGSRQPNSKWGQSLGLLPLGETEFVPGFNLCQPRRQERKGGPPALAGPLH